MALEEERRENRPEELLIKLTQMHEHLPREVWLGLRSCLLIGTRELLGP